MTLTVKVDGTDDVLVAPAVGAGEDITMSTLLRPNVIVDQIVDVLLSVTVGRRADGSLHGVVQFPDGQQITSAAGDPDLGFNEPDTVLHDVAHTLLTARLGLDRSPVLERVVDLRPLSQTAVDLEEAATFALQAFAASLRGEDPAPAIANVRSAIDRSFPVESVEAAR